MPEGWRKAFGIEMCKEIKKCLKKANYVRKYRITEIKEKYGTLRWYDCGAPEAIFDELEDIISKYEDMSMLYCINCGEIATTRTNGWIMYLCDKCNPDGDMSIQLTWNDIPRRTKYDEKGNKTVIKSPVEDLMKANWIPLEEKHD